MIKHSKCCRKFKQTKIKTLPKNSPVPEKLIARVMRSMIYSEPDDKPLPADADTILPYLEKQTKIKGRRHRHPSRSEAISQIRGDSLALHDSSELFSRENAIEELLTKVLGYTDGYLMTIRSSLTDFPVPGDDYVHPCWHRDHEAAKKCKRCSRLIKARDGEIYHKLAQAIEKYYGMPICAKCLSDAKYIWREVDLINSYRKSCH